MNHPTNSKVVIITGASSGIGAATARRLARDGMFVTLAARRQDRLEQVAADVESSGGEALVVQTDVRNRAEIARMIQSTLDRWNRIDVLLNNAGMGNDRSLLRVKPEKIRDEISLNLSAVIECAQAVLPVMLRQKSGHIINVASIAGLVGVPSSTIYCATKFGVNGFSDALRRELLGTGIAVSAFCPGFTPSEISPDLKAIAEGKPGAPRRFGLMPVTYVADQITHLIRHPKRQVIIPPSWKFLVLIAFLFPGLADLLIHQFVSMEKKRIQ
jgi:short-subunit dehydrogenase